MDTNLLTYSEDLYTRLNSTLWKVRGGLWFNLWGSYFVPGTKIDQWNYWGGFCFVRSSWLCIKAETLRLFVLLSYAIETCGIQETFLANIFRQVSFNPPPSFLHSVGFVYIFIWIFLTSPRIYSAFSLQNGRVNTTLSQRALTKRIAPC